MKYFLQKVEKFFIDDFINKVMENEIIKEEIEKIELDNMSNYQIIEFIASIYNKYDLDFEYDVMELKKELKKRGF